MAGAAGVISDEIRELLENEQDAEYEEVRWVGGAWVRRVCVGGCGRPATAAFS